MSWSAFAEDPTKVGGILLKGDTTVPPTRWWNHLFLLWWYWKQVSVIEIVGKYNAPYSIGYIPFTGKAMIWSEEFRGRCFAVRHGHEDCRFFALDRHGFPAELRPIQRTMLNELDDDIPLI